MAKIEIAAGLSMDAGEAATQTFGAISAKGGGKSYLAGKFVEGLYDAGAPFVVLDPVGNWSALTLGKDGKSAGLGVVVIGGDRGDVPLDEGAAEAIGEKLVWDGISAVVDLSELSKTKRRSYVAGFCEAMFRMARKKRTPFMLILEEAQLFAPQNCDNGEKRMLGAVTDIVRLGRNYGLGSMLVSQRPQSVSKEVLNQVECLFVGQLRGPQERKAIAGWVTEQSVDEAVDMKSLPALKVGEFFCWSPSWLRVFKRVEVLSKRTYDGSSTPVLGLASALPRARTSKDITPVAAALRALSEPEEAADSPAGTEWLDGESPVMAELQELRSRCGELEQENDSLRQRLTDASDVLDAVWKASEVAVKGLEDVRRVSAPWLDNPSVWGSRVPAEPPARRQQPAFDTHAAGRRGFEVDGKVAKTRPMASDGSKLDKADAAILSVLAWQKTAVDKRKLALLAGYSAGGGGFNNALSRLRTAKRIEGSGLVGITAAGRIAIAGVGLTVAPPPRGTVELQRWWLQHPKVDTCMRAILEALMKTRKPLHPDALAVAAGYKPKTGGFSNGLSRLRTLGLVVGKGRQPVQLAEELR